MNLKIGQLVQQKKPPNNLFVLLKAINLDPIIPVKEQSFLKFSDSYESLSEEAKNKTGVILLKISDFNMQPKKSYFPMYFYTHADEQEKRFVFMGLSFLKEFFQEISDTAISHKI